MITLKLSEWATTPPATTENPEWPLSALPPLPPAPPPAPPPLLPPVASPPPEPPPAPASVFEVGGWQLQATASARKTTTANRAIDGQADSTAPEGHHDFPSGC